MKLNRNSKIFINYLLGPLLFVWLSWAIYRHIMLQPNLGVAWQKIKNSFSGPLGWNLVGAVFLIFINWFIEAAKWKLSIAEVQRISYFRAFKAVLSGVSFSVSTPNRVGEYLGRLLYMNDGNRLKTIALTIVASISQLIITLLAGCIGLIVFKKQIESSQLISGIWLQVVLYGAVAVLLFLTLFYFRLSWLAKWIDRLPGSRKILFLLAALENFNATLLVKLLSLSALRFLVFIVQYYLLFQLFLVHISWWQAFWGVSVSFLVMAVIPTFAIAELGLRGEVSIRIIGMFSSNSLGIWMTSVTIWLLNLVIPAMIGSLLILGIKKIFPEKDKSENNNIASDL